LKKKGYEIPLSSRTNKGIHTANLLALAPEEKVASTITLKSLDIDGYFIMITKNGLIKRSEIREYDTSLRKRGLKALTLREEDELVQVIHTSGQEDILLVTSNGMAVRYSEDNVRSVGRTGLGVRSMNLGTTDTIISMIKINPTVETDILVITENGFGKKTNAGEYRALNGRYAKGSRTINSDAVLKAGKIVSGVAIEEGKEFLVLTQKGKITRLSNEDFVSKGRATKGSRIVSLDDSDRVLSLVVVDSEL
jgi:DNA gyrase subunit A